MAIPLLPILLLAGGAAVVASGKKKKRLIPIGHAEDKFWVKVYAPTPNSMQPISSENAGIPQWEIYKRAADLVRTGDLIEVIVQGGADRNLGEEMVPGAEVMPWTWTDWQGGLEAAWYTVTKSPKDDQVMQVHDRPILLEAKLIHGVAPKLWRILERKNAKDTDTPKHSSFASRTIRPIYTAPGEVWRGLHEPDSTYEAGGELLFPEIMTIVRDKKRVYHVPHPMMEDGSFMTNQDRGELEDAGLLGAYLEKHSPEYVNF